MFVLISHWFSFPSNLVRENVRWRFMHMNQDYILWNLVVYLYHLVCFLPLFCLSCTSDVKSRHESDSGRNALRTAGASVPLSSKWSQMSCDRFDGWCHCVQGRVILGFWWDCVLRHHFAHFCANRWCCNINKRQLIRLTKPREQQHGKHHANLLSSRVYR